MADNRVLDILKQVEAGDLTPEEADRALAGIGAAAPPPPPPSTPQPPNTPGSPAPPEAPAWGHHLDRGFDRMREKMERQRERMERRRVRMERRMAHRHEQWSRRTAGGYTVDHLIRLRLHGISPDYVEEMREAGLEDLSTEDLVQLRVHNVTPDYVAEIRERLGDVPVGKLVEFRIHGVTADLIEELQEAGVESATPDDILRWRHSTKGTRFGEVVSDAVSTAMDAVGPHVAQLVESALADARRAIYDALRVSDTPPEEWRSVNTAPAAESQAETKTEANSETKTETKTETKSKADKAKE